MKLHEEFREYENLWNDQSLQERFLGGGDIISTDPFIMKYYRKEYDLAQKSELLNYLKAYTKHEYYMNTRARPDDEMPNAELTKERKLKAIREQEERYIVKEAKQRGVDPAVISKIKTWIVEFEKENFNALENPGLTYAIDNKEAAKIRSEAATIIKVLKSYSDIENKIDLNDLLNQLITNRETIVVNVRSDVHEIKNNSDVMAAYNAWPFR